MRANNTIYFAVRASKSRQNGMCPIQVQLSKSGERSSFSTGKVVKVSDWDAKNQKVRGKDEVSLEVSLELNRFLDSVRARLYYLYS